MRMADGGLSGARECLDSSAVAGEFWLRSGRVTRVGVPVLVTLASATGVRAPASLVKLTCYPFPLYTFSILI